MCRVCKMPLDDEAKVFKEIEKKIKSGTDPEHFQQVLDKILGTTVPERNTEIEEAWEKRNRKGDSNE